MVGGRKWKPTKATSTSTSSPGGSDGASGGSTASPGQSPDSSTSPASSGSPQASNLEGVDQLHLTGANTVFNAVRFIYGSAALYRFARLCDGLGKLSSKFCVRSSLYTTYLTAIVAVFQILTVLATFTPALESVLIQWGFFMTIGALIQGVVVVGLVGVWPSSVSRIAEGVPSSDFGWLEGVFVPLCVMLLYFWRERRRILVYCHDMTYTLTSAENALWFLYQTSSPLVPFVLWAGYFRGSMPSESDLPDWPGTGIVLWSSLIAVNVVYFFLKFRNHRLYGPVLWQEYGRRGVVLQLVGNTIVPLVLY